MNNHYISPGSRSRDPQGFCRVTGVSAYHILPHKLVARRLTFLKYLVACYAQPQPKHTFQKTTRNKAMHNQNKLSQPLHHRHHHQTLHLWIECALLMAPSTLTAVVIVWMWWWLNCGLLKINIECFARFFAQKHPATKKKVSSRTHHLQTAISSSKFLSPRMVLFKF